MSGGTSFDRLVQCVAALEQTASKLDKRHLLAAFLKELAPEEVGSGALLLIGRIFPDPDSRALKVGWASVQRALDGLGPPAGTSTLTLAGVYGCFEQIAQAAGPDSQRTRQDLLQRLFSRGTQAERAVLLRIISGEMRTGASEGLLLDAIAEASGVPNARLREAHLVVSDIAQLAALALTRGEQGLAAAALTPLTPVKPMLADLGQGPADVLAEHGGATAVEFKLDGVRIQVHRVADQVRVFSRRLIDVTPSVPEVVEWALAAPAQSLIVEGELVAVDGAGRPRPFQEVMRRFGRVHDIEALRREVPVKLQLFDLLWLNGKSFTAAPYRERWAALESVASADVLVPRRVTSNAQEMEAFLAESMRLGHEGLMAKALDAPYALGRRGKKWLKLKPAETLDVALLAAEWGHGRRTGSLSNYWLGVRDGDGWQMVGKTFKGLTDAERAEVMRRLLAVKASEDEWVVHVRPEVIVEVTYNEIQKSPRYPSGFSLRFARVTRIRDDKGPADADTYARLKQLFAQQFERKSAG
jgi:DNA ligase-1